jgi:hypothetical protein
MIAETVCPNCGGEHAPSLRVTVETPRRAAKRPVTPEVLYLCPTCHALLILALHPAPQKGINS